MRKTLTSDELMSILKEKLGSDEAVLEYVNRVRAGAEQSADLPRIKVHEKWTVEKFHGEWAPGKLPVETIRIGD